jgi:hypothetical protein
MDYVAAAHSFDLPRFKNTKAKLLAQNDYHRTGTKI